MKISIIYDSKTENTSTVAGYIAEGINKENIDVKIFNINSVDFDYVKDSNGVIFGSPTYAAGPTSDFYSFLEKNGGKLNLAGKLGGVFATEQYIHGGADLVMISIIEHLLVYGMMIYSSGASNGKPVIHIGPVEVSPNKEQFKDLFVIYGERFAEQLKKVV